MVDTQDPCGFNAEVSAPPGVHINSDWNEPAVYIKHKFTVQKSHLPRKMMFYTYILYSSKLDRYYVGTTDHVDRRVNEHNSAYYKNAYTSKGIPWELKLSIPCANSSEAYRLETFIKKMKSRVFIEKMVSDNELVEGIRLKLK